jgi:type I restriction enzyme, S subunit
VSNCRTGEVLNDDELVYISEEKHQDLIRSEVLPGDVLLTKAGYILGYSAVFPETLIKGNITSHLAAIRPSANIVSEFLSVYLRSNLGKKQIYRWGNKSTRPELNTEEVRQILVPLPSLEIQRSLVAEIEAARQTRKQKLAQADELLSSLDAYLLAQLGLTPPEESDGKVFAIRKGQIQLSRIDSFFYTPSLIKAEQLVRGFKPKSVPLISLLREPPLNGVDARDYEETGRSYLRVQNIRPFEIIQDDVKYVSFAPSKDILLKVGDVLLTRKGTFGVAAVVSEADENCLISSEIILLRILSNADCSADYLAAWLNSSLATAILNRHKTGGIMGHITQDVVSEFPVPIPAQDIQHKIVSEIHQKRKQAHLIRQQAEIEWETAKTRFERKLLGEET